MKLESGFAITRRKGFHIKFENGYTVSVQFGAGNYCDNYNSNEFMPEGNIESSQAEIAAWDSNGNWVPFEDDDVKGWQSPAEVLEFINRIAAM